jgi:hypothetical protein
MKPRVADTEDLGIEEQELCKHKNTKGTVYVYDSDNNPLYDVSIRFKCLDSSCYIGNTVNGSGTSVLTDKFPQCVNGFIIASKDGYADKKLMVSSLNEFTASVYMDELKELDINLKSSSSSLNSKESIIVFDSEEYSTSIYLPDQTTVRLIPELYTIKVYTFESGSIALSDNIIETCVDVPASGIGGLFGLTREECFEQEVPETIENILIGGGTSEKFIDEDTLKSSNKINLDINLFDKPNSMEDLQLIYELAEISDIQITFA